MSGTQELDGVLGEFIPASWFHPVGVMKVVKRLEEKLPDVSGKLFITLTLDPGLFPGPKAGFEKARDRIRRIFFKLRKGVNWQGKKYQLNVPYCIKLEFHDNGWPHFHIIFLTRRFLPGELLSNLWKYGRVNIARITKAEFNYLLKYVTKSGQLPDWIKDYRTIRIFQASKGFYRKRDPPDDAAESESKSRKHPEKRVRGKLGTIRDRIKKWERLAQYTSRGKYSCFLMDEPWKKVFPEKVYEIAMEGRYLGQGKVQITKPQDLMNLLSEETLNQIK